MICRYYLMIGSNKVDRDSEYCIDVSSMIANLKDIKLSYNRIDYGGVTRKCGSNIEFVGNARIALIEHFVVNGLNSEASFAVYGIEDNWIYTEIFSCPLDFSTFSYDSYKVEIGCLDNSIAALIKANKTTKYEYSVSDIKDTLRLAYDRVSIRNEVTIQVLGNKQLTGEDTYTEVNKNVWWFYPRIGVISSDTPNNESITFQDSEETFQTDGTPMIWGMLGLNKTDIYFLECLKDCVVSIDFTDIGLSNSLRGCVLAKVSGNNITPLNCGYSNVMSRDENTLPSAVKWSGELKEGERLQFVIYNYNHGKLDGSVGFEAHKDGYISWNERQEPVYLDIISPEVLLGKLISSICPGLDVKCKIKMTLANGIDNTRLIQTMLCPAECVRQFSSAKVYTSFDDFCKWMETAFGYIYQIDNMSESDDEFILSDIYDFTCIYNSEYVEKLDDIVFRDYMFGSNRLGYFFKVVSEEHLEGSYDYDFIGYEDYQSQEWGNDPTGVKVHTDRLFRSTEDLIIFSAVNYTEPTYTSGAKYRWYSELKEAVIENVNTSRYVDTVEFGFIINEKVAVSGVYTGEVAIENICYCRKNVKFMYKSDGKYYHQFTGSDKYNNGDVVRDDMMFISNGQNYIIVQDCLVKCTVTEGEVDETKYPTIIFRHKSEVFDKSSVLHLTNISDFTYKLATDRLYSRLSIGYEKQDYDLGNNGKDEFNFKSVYTTGVTLDNKELNMVSPYRADSYGIEELSNKIGEETSSTDSDTQLFAISCVKTDNEYVVLRNNRTEGVSTDSMFNAELAPIFMIEANKSYLASFAKKLTFVSSEGNSSIYIDGKSVAGDIDLSDSLFGHGNISFTTDELVLPNNWNGCVEISWNGEMKKGFLSTLDISVANNEAFEYELIEC